MRRFLWVSLFALLATGADAQSARGFGNGGAGVGGARQSGFGRNNPRGIFGPDRFRGGFNNHGFGFGFGFGFNRGPFGFPFGFGNGSYGAGWVGLPPDYGPYDTGYGYQPESARPAQPTVIVIPQPVPTPTSYAQPPRAGQTIVEEYGPPAPAIAQPSTTGVSTTFGIVLKNGTKIEAIGAVVNDGLLKYADPDQRNREVALSEVDREATLKVNRDRGLNLWLP